MPLLAMERRGCELVEQDGAGLLGELLEAAAHQPATSSSVSIEVRPFGGIVFPDRDKCDARALKS
jgi:hypothetical protein